MSLLNSPTLIMMIDTENAVYSAIRRLPWSLWLYCLYAVRRPFVTLMLQVWRCASEMHGIANSDQALMLLPKQLSEDMIACICQRVIC